MWKNSKKVLAGIVLVVTPMLASASGESSGGGDKDGLAAAAALKLVPQKLMKLGSDLITAEELKSIEEVATSETTLIMMTEDKQTSEAAGIKQQGTAFSVTGTKFRVTSIYRQDWNNTKDDLFLQIAFMTHEACVLTGIEQTGAYGRVSATLLNRLRNEALSDRGTSEKAALQTISSETLRMMAETDVYVTTGIDPVLRNGIKTDCDLLKHFNRRITRIEEAAKSCAAIPNIVPLARLARSVFPKVSDIEAYCKLVHSSPSGLFPLIRDLDGSFRQATYDLYMAATQNLSN